MNKLVLGVILLGTALPVAVGLIYGLGLLLALIFIQILAQVQDPPTMVLEKGNGTLSEGGLQTVQMCVSVKCTDDWNKKTSFT